MWQIQLRVNNLPIGLILRADATLAFVPLAHDINFLDETNERGTIDALFTPSNIWFGDEEFDWGKFYEYKEIPEMLQWLKQQNMENPFTQEETDVT